jgi:hypothetical protein
MTFSTFIVKERKYLTMKKKKNMKKNKKIRGKNYILFKYFHGEKKPVFMEIKT